MIKTGGQKAHPYEIAAAFSVVIFVILLVFSIFFVRRTRGTEAAY